jgi:hypothetical protein
MPLSETFLISLTATGSATFLVCLRWAYRSKCSRVSCCGLLIERDVIGEERLDTISPQDSEKIPKEDSPKNTSLQMLRL